MTLLRWDGAEERILVLPGGQGDDVQGVRVISPRSPLARALVGREPGELITVRRGGRRVELELDAVE